MTLVIHSLLQHQHEPTPTRFPTIRSTATVPGGDKP
jgi:hypothetical protein